MRLAPRVLAAVPLGLAGCRHLDDAADCAPHHAPQPAAVQPYLGARDLVRGPLAAQAGNGAVLSATLFNEHFRTGFEELNESRTRFVRRVRPSAELLPAGVAVIERQARQAADGTLTLFVQSAQDVPLDQAAVAASAAQRAEVNADRAARVREVALAVRPDLDVQVTVLDVPSVGMGGREAQTGLPKLYGAPEGFLTRDAVLGVNIGGAASLFGGLSGGSVGGTNAPSAAPPAEAAPPPTAAPGGLNPGGG